MVLLKITGIANQNSKKPRSIGKGGELFLNNLGQRNKIILPSKTNGFINFSKQTFWAKNPNLPIKNNSF